MKDPKLVVVSNRLPVSLRKLSRGRFKATPGHGGLVTALSPVLRERAGIWIGWPGTQVDEKMAALRDAVGAAGRDMGIELRSVALTAAEVKGYYRGFANEVLWPLFHDLLAQCNFDPAFWQSYRAANRKMAVAAERASTAHDFIWVQDYHLLQLARELRRRGTNRQVGFFLHVPFPAPDMFLRLPWRMQLLSGLLDFDVVGFQSERDRGNFLQCVSSLVPGSRFDGDVTVEVSSSREGDETARSVRVGSFPIGIDSASFREVAESEAVAERAKQLRSDLGGETILLGVDRLDYTKGLLHKLRGYRAALKRFRKLRERVRLVQHVVPSREAVPQYRRLRPEVERLVGEINGEFGTPGWTPVHYFYKALDRRELVAYYRMADVLLVTSLKDGMNLVAKEYCASNVDEHGVLVLSEFTGAASQLGEQALVVNPYDVEGLARAIREAVSMPVGGRRARMRQLRRVVASSDVYRWVSSFLDAVPSQPSASAPRDVPRRTASYAGSSPGT